MKFFAVAAVAMAAMVSAQSRSEIPSCALPCLDDSVKKETSCATDDFKCVCSTENFTKVQGDATTCVISKCGQDTALNKVLPAVKKVCDEAQSGSSSSMPASSMAMSSMAMSSAGMSSAAMPTVTATMSEGSGNNTQPTTPPVVAGAAGFAPLGGLAIAALAAVAL